MTRRMLCFAWMVAGLALAAPLPSSADTSPAASVQAAGTPSAALVRQYLDARAAGQATHAYALLSSLSQAGLPLHQVPKLIKEVLNPAFQFQEGELPMIALFADFHDTFHFKFRVLGASRDDPSVVLVRASQVGTASPTVTILKIVTAADPIAGGARRIDGVRTTPIFFPDGPVFSQRVASQLNLKQIALGIIQYARHNNTLPDAANWVDEIMPYMRSEAVFHDPSAPESQKWSYAYNSTLSHQPLSKLNNPADTVMLFESTTGTKNASDGGQSVPHPGRHIDATDYAFADGHVDWFQDETKLSYLLNGR